jgi:hypothetical protein
MEGKSNMITPIDPQVPGKPPLINQQRRHLTKAGLAVPIVTSALLSRPVLGAAPHNCTISGKLSGNTSTHGELVDCSTLGLSPGYWRNHLDVWSPLLYEAKFNTVFEDAYWWQPKNSNTFQLAKPNTANYFPDPTMVQIMGNGGGMDASKNFPSLGRAAVASWLNAYHQPNYPLTQLQVIALFNAVYDGGSYEVKPGAFWNAGCVICYFESLYNFEPGEQSECTPDSCAGL